MKIPITFGIVGHRNLREEDVLTLKRKVGEILKDLIKRYPDSKLCMLNSLAEGADQLCFDVALEMGIPVIAVLPMPPEVYQADFSGKVLEHFKILLQQAQSVIIAPTLEPVKNGSRDSYYRASGVYLVSHSHFLIALWDGEAGDVDGCGTAAIATMKLLDFNAYEPTLLFAESGGVVIQIVTPRSAGPELKNAFEIITHESLAGNLDAMLEATDEFNRNAEGFDERSCATLIDATLMKEIDPVQRTLHGLYQTSDGLSLLYRKHYLSALKQMSFCAVSLVVGFLLYDELEADLFLFVYGLVMLVTFAIYQSSKQRKNLRKYLEYRVLAETARTQFFLDLVGLNQNATTFFNWTQKRSHWIRLALATVQDTRSARKIFDVQSIKRTWIDEQLDYYRKTLDKTLHTDQRNSLISKSLLICSLAIFLLVLILETAFKGIMTAVIPLDSIRSLLLIHAETAFIVRGLLKILLGLFSSVTLFLSAYYGKLSLRSKISDYEKMIRIYATAQTRFSESMESRDSLFLDLAKEEIRENGNWFEYSSGNEITLEP